MNSKVFAGLTIKAENNGLRSYTSFGPCIPDKSHYHIGLPIAIYYRNIRLGKKPTAKNIETL